MVNPDDTNGVTPVERKGTQAYAPAAEAGSSAMDVKVLLRLQAIRKANGNTTWINRDLYRLMYMPGLYALAYERIKSSPGNMTPGIDKQTLDGFSMSSVEKIVQMMRDETFQFSRARRVNIPKANGGTRPLGVASPRDKVVQEAMRLILEAIFDSPQGSSFSELSFGFRSGLGTHSALKHIKENWSGTTWFIEGDIKGCFDNIDHHRLVEILRKRIADERFLNLIWKALTAGYMEFRVPVNSVVGTPQGSIISPILANVYMHELDTFVQNLRRKYEREATREYDDQYSENMNALKRVRRRLLKASGMEREALVTELSKLQLKATTLPVWKDSGRAVRIKYVRYADDWLIGLAGSKELAETLRNEIEDFLAQNLKLTLSREKTHIRHAKTEEAFFLGTRIRGGTKHQRSMTVERIRNGEKQYVYKRTTVGTIAMFAPIPRIIERLHRKGYCDAKGQPRSMPALSVQDDFTIVEEFNAVLRGYLNYYSFAANYSRLRRVAYILQHGAAKTLAHKHRSTMRKVFRKHGTTLKVNIQTTTGKVRETSLDYPSDWKANTRRFLVNAAPDKIDVLHTQAGRLTRSKLGDPCCICGSDDRVEMHHVRAVRKSGKNINKGFDRLMGVINRKQIPVCRTCHENIHAGLYDGRSLSDFADPHNAAR